MLRAVLQSVQRISLVFLLAGIPLIVNPVALLDYHCKPKIESVYALLIIIGAASLALHAAGRKMPALVRTPVTLPVCLYVVSAVVSTIFSVSIRKSLNGDFFREESVFAIASYALIVFAFAALVTTAHQARTLVRALLVSSTIISIYAVAEYMGFEVIEHTISVYNFSSIGSTIGNANQLGKFLVLVLPLFCAAFFSAASRGETIFYLCGGMSAAGALLLSFSRGSWLGAAAAFAIFFSMADKAFLRSGFRNKKKLFFTALTLILITGGYGIAKTTPQQRGFYETMKEKIASLADLEAGAGSGTRLYLWKKGIAAAKKRPFFGYGPDCQIFALRPFNAEFNRLSNSFGILDRAHNNYIDIAISQGLFGLAAYLWVVATFIFWLFGVMKNETDGTTRIFFCAVFSAVVGFCINSLFIFSSVAVEPTFWSLLGLTIAVRRCSGRGNSCLITKNAA